MDPAATLDMPARPWSAEIKDPLNDKHPKYNLPLATKPGDERSQMLATALTSASSLSPMAKSQSTRALKEQWATTAAKGVDYERPRATVPGVADENAARSKEPTELLQVRAACRARTPPFPPYPQTADCAARRARVQGYKKHLHPMFGEQKY